MQSGWYARLAIGWLVAVAVAVAACGRIGFEPADRVADDAVPIDGTMPIDSSIDAGICAYLSTCMTGQITCCTATQSFCTLEGPGTCTGTIARCSIFTQQGCPAGWACCTTPQRPEPSCYTPMLPQPC
jgi:hypothetical protein